MSGLSVVKVVIERGRRANRSASAHAVSDMQGVTTHLEMTLGHAHLA